MKIKIVIKFVKSCLVLLSFVWSIYSNAAFIQTDVLRIDANMNVSNVNSFVSSITQNSDISSVRDFHHMGNGRYFALTNNGLFTNGSEATALNQRISNASAGGQATEIFSTWTTNQLMWIRAGTEVLQIDQNFNVGNVDSFLNFLGISDSADVVDYHRTLLGTYHVIANETYYTNGSSNANNTFLSRTQGQQALDFFGDYRRDIWIQTASDFFVVNETNVSSAASAAGYFQSVENITVSDVLDHGRFDNGRTITLTDKGLFSNLYGGDRGNDIMNQRIAAASGGGVIGEILSVDYQNNIAFVTAGRIEELNAPAVSLLALLLCFLGLKRRSDYSHRKNAPPKMS
ncbi:hypothetical protein [Glaciecola sp. KUL10]|uniref:hypothetical protein n=1 Tax=Glaciecola sp. (strain KUL10) TaxID=2161813 RepID=UPI000D78747B|nr:hypothetical protein [Glaciecola sp. KUL10]GBL04334.1 site-determining protein [Glaciecola sp. KUL10]